MRTYFRKYLVLSLLVSLTQVFMKAQKSDNQRLIVLADMGNESDEEQQITHLLLCSNEIDLEGLVAVTGKYLRPESKTPYKQVLHPELFTEIINGYGAVYKNLQVHDPTYPSPDFLHSIVCSGQSGYGMEATGDGQSSAGSKLIIEAAEKDDPRPLYIVVNAGSNTLAQALKDYQKTHSEKK